MSERPNCYDCKYRGTVSGSVHSSCQHPEAGALNDDPLMNIFAIFASVGRTAPMQGKTTLHIVSHPTGIRRGWFNWPWNFDPVWLLECDGFATREAR